MSESNMVPVECDDCDEDIRLVIVERRGHALTCGCEDRILTLDADEAVMMSNLFDPISGKWSMIDHDSDIGRSGVSP